jgi:hypothetical protein
MTDPESNPTLWQLTIPLSQSSLSIIIDGLSPQSGHEALEELELEELELEEDEEISLLELELELELLEDWGTQGHGAISSLEEELEDEFSPDELELEELSEQPSASTSLGSQPEP